MAMSSILSRAGRLTHSWKSSIRVVRYRLRSPGYISSGRRIHLRGNARTREGADGAKGRDAGATQVRLAGDRAAGGHAPRWCQRPHVLTVVYLSCAGNQCARLPCACARAGSQGSHLVLGRGPCGGEHLIGTPTAVRGDVRIASHALHGLSAGELERTFVVRSAGPAVRVWRT